MTADVLPPTFPTLTLPAPDDDNERFGGAIAVDGDTMVIGARLLDGGAANQQDAGAAHVYVRSGSAWQLQATLRASNIGERDYFSQSVAISGDTIVVGAFEEDGPDDSVIESGAAYVFVRNGSNWSEQAILRAADPEPGDRFGHKVAVDGDTAVIGVLYDNGSTQSTIDAGSAHLFVRSGSSWSQQAILWADSPGQSDFFSNSLAVSGDTVFVGAPFKDNSKGAVFIYQRNGTSWSRQFTLQGSDAAADDRFGYSLSLSGDTLAIGAQFKAAAGGIPQGAGAVYIFEWNGTSWDQKALLSADNAGDSDLFGTSVAVDGNTLVVGATRERGPDDALFAAGAAYLFGRNGSTWHQLATLRPDVSAARDYFGISVGSLGDSLIVGAEEDGGVQSINAGAANVFDLQAILTADRDSDGASDSWEIFNGFDPSLPGDFATLDTDNDGTIDLIEIFQGTDRDVASALFQLDSPEMSGSQFQASFTRSTIQSAVQATYQWSSNLTDWQEDGQSLEGIAVDLSESAVPNVGDTGTVTVSADIIAGITDKLFIRLLFEPLE